MKLNDVKPHYESSDGLDEVFFSIKDQGMIFDILRNKMYANPILAICREISCNARDAHREIGVQDEPVHIHIPNNLEPYYKIKDFGPGISTDRMYNIFIQYTASTKRNDNTQTGGFGLGAKTPFSYSDSFSIITIHNGIKYNYGCAIDETKVGKISLFSKIPTDEANGTEIIIPVKPVDFKAFADCTELSTRHWDVKPVITGFPTLFVWKNINRILDGKNWALMASDGYSRSAKIIIDGIEYPLEYDSLRKYTDPKLLDSLRGNIVLYFEIGELTLSANREQIHLDEQTKLKIKIRLEDMSKDIKYIIHDKIKKFTNLWDANVFYRKELSDLFYNCASLGKLEWQGIELTLNSYFSVDCSVFSFTKGTWSRKHGDNPDKLSRSLSQCVSFQENSSLFLNDLSIKEPTPKHVKKIFDDNPKLKSISVICPKDDANKKDLYSKHHLDKMNISMLSAFTNATGRNYTAPSLRLLVFKFDSNASAFRQVSYSLIKEDKNTQKVLCNLTKINSIYPNIRTIILKSKKHISLDSMRSISAKFTDVSFYGIDDSVPEDRIKTDFDGFIDIEDFINDKIIKNKSIDFNKIKFIKENKILIDYHIMKIFDELHSKIINRNNPFIKVCELQNKFNLEMKDQALLSFYEMFGGVISKKDIAKFLADNPDYDIDKMIKIFNDTYPLMRHLNYYNRDMHDQVIDYINMVDKIQEIKK
ncbi:HATPase_c domain containing protein [uncultured Caudovirales phage]|uniref:HATPase_c domain containing protein n=1 Tax=uncultured Caudovirales phage TaxID=2100421 RepID=A0A6J5RTR1_9CAUD|nr:HATPase_c domain containing protein [uncultured Caudovirales phage]